MHLTTIMYASRRCTFVNNRQGRNENIALIQIVIGGRFIILPLLTHLDLLLTAFGAVENNFQDSRLPPFVFRATPLLQTPCCTCRKHLYSMYSISLRMGGREELLGWGDGLNTWPHRALPPRRPHPVRNHPPAARRNRDAHVDRVLISYQSLLRQSFGSGCFEPMLFFISTGEIRL